MKYAVRLLSSAIELPVSLLSPSSHKPSVGVMEWSCVAQNRNSILPLLQVHGEISL